MQTSDLRWPGLLLLLLAPALAAADAAADEFIIDMPVIVQNGGNTLDGNDTLIILPGGSITTAGIPPVLGSGTGNTVDNRGTLFTDGFGTSGIVLIDSNTILNSGTLTANGGFAFGFDVFDSNFMVNSGTVSVSGDFSVAIDAVDFNTIVNHGLLTATGDVSTGISLGDDNRVFNFGGISATGTEAEAIFGGDSNSIFNRGVMRVDGPDSAVIDVDDFNTIANYGLLSGTGEVSTGIIFDHDNTVFNAGDIMASGTDAAAIFGGDSNSIVNHGNMTVDGPGSATIDLDDYNTIVNHGVLSATGEVATGILFDHDNAVFNYGRIIVSGDEAEGIFGGNGNGVHNFGSMTSDGPDGQLIDLNDFNTVINAGSLMTAGEAADAIDVEDSNLVINHGSIVTTGINADGIDVVNDNTVVNTGTIIVRGSPDDSGLVPSAIDARGRNTISNTGYLLSVQGHAIELSGADNTLNFYPPSFLGGRIVLGTDATVNIVTGRSYSLLWDFSTGSLAGGMPNISGPAPYFWNAGTRQFATIDPSMLSAAPESLSQFVGGLSDPIRRRLARAHQTSSPAPAPLAYDGTSANAALAALGTQVADRRRGAWADFIGGFASDEQTILLNGTTRRQYGVVAGFDGPVASDLTLGVMAGYATGRLSADTVRGITSEVVDSRGVFAGVYGRSELARTHVDFALVGGWQDNDGRRFVNNNLAPLGAEVAVAGYDSWFVSPEATIGIDIEAGGGLTLQPSATARYAAQWIGGYSESGAMAAASVAGRTVQIAEGQLEAAASQRFAHGALTLRAGVVGRTVLGGAAADVTLIGSTVSVGGERAQDLVSGYVGGDAMLALDDRWSMSLAARAQLSQDSGQIYSGRFGIAANF